MCEIQFAISNRQIISGDIRNLLNMGHANGNKDATGVLALSNGKWNWAKTAGNYGQLLATDGNHKKLLREANAIIGHNRWTTQGDGTKNNDNNHPFVVGDWTLIHNGILYGDTTARKIIDNFDDKNPKYSHIETDSFAFFKVFLSFIGDDTSDACVKTAIEETIALYSGDFSIFITNTTTNVGYYFRCGMRHFYFRGYVKGDVWKILGSTTEENLNQIVTANQCGVFRQITTSALYEFVPDKHVLYIIDFNAKEMVDVITYYDTIKYAEKERIYWENEERAPTYHEWTTYYDTTADWLRTKGITYDNIEWIDETAGYFMKNLTMDELAEFELAAEFDNIYVSAVHGDYVEFTIDEHIISKEEKWVDYE